MVDLGSLSSMARAMIVKNPQICSLLFCSLIWNYVAAQRELFSSPNGVAEDVVWVVQLSDLHISIYHPERAQDLEELGGKMLALLKPALVLITGDLTDAKNKDRTVTRQDEAEWVQYQQTMERVMQKSGLPKNTFFDLRGNHDKFGVPFEGSTLDYFSKYSISAQLNRTSRVQSVTILDNTGSKHLFVGLDNAMSTGLRGPCNFFGHPTDSRLVELDLELRQWEKENSLRSKIVFGHFPLSFTAATETGTRLERVFASHDIDSYICGHLHTKFGEQLYRHHIYENGEFWEWEMGDWRGSRIMRVLAIDNGHVSFHEISLEAFDSRTIVIPTYPVDSRSMQRTSLTRNKQYGNYIKALVFSEYQVTTVIAKVFDMQSGVLLLAEELELQPSSKHNHLYKSKWKATKYSGTSSTRFWLQFFVTDASGQQSTTKLMPFSVDGKGSHVSWGLSEFFVMGVCWDDLYPLLFWANIGFLFTMLVIPKLLQYYLKDSCSDGKWALSLCNSTSCCNSFSMTIKVILWILIEGCQCPYFCWLQCLYILYLTQLPWFWGYPFGEEFPAGYMTFSGWTVHLSHEWQNLGSPDIMVIVIPFLYFIILPLFLLSAFLSAERSFCEFHAAQRLGSHKKQEIVYNGKQAVVVENNKKDDGSLHLLSIEKVDKTLVSRCRCKICRRWIRKALICSSFIIAYFHYRQCSWIARAYGPLAVVLSPGFAWPVPMFLIAGIYESSSLRFGCSSKG